LSASSVAVRLAALRFFYCKTLRRTWSLTDTPYPKKTHRLPTILSREEVAQLLHAARTPGERILLMTLYASGARNAELTHLKVSDIVSPGAPPQNLLLVLFTRLSPNQSARRFVAHVAQLRSPSPPCRTIPDATLRLFVILRRRNQ
jgi:hypothetical protein